jgi:hypothetical protein
LTYAAGTKLAGFMLESLGTLRSQAFFPWFDPMGLQGLQRKSALNCAPVSVELATASTGATRHGRRERCDNSSDGRRNETCATERR